MLDKLRYLKSIGSDQLIFLMGLFFVILAIMILRYTLKHPRLGAEGKHKIMRIGLFISIAALAFCGVCYIDMALAAESALKNYVPKGRLHPVKEDWIPELMKRDCYK